MASTRTKNLARAIQHATPGMKYTEALRHAEAGHVVIDPKGDPMLALDQIAGASTTPLASPRGIDPFQTQYPSEGEASGRVVLDEWHDLRHAPKAAAEDLARHFSRAGRNPSPIHAWPVNLGIGLDTESVHLSLLDPPSKNLAVCGPSMAGHTALLRSLVEGALRNGWQASVVDPKADEYRDLREGPYGERVNGARDGNVSAGPLDQETMRAFIENGITAGTKDQPRLVVIDNGDYLFEPEPGAKRGEGWLVELARLLDHPYTAVVIQCSALRRSVIPAHIIDRLAARLLLGMNDTIAHRIAFGDAVSSETLDVFLDLGGRWLHLAEGDAHQGKGVLWDGQRLRRIRVPLD